MAAMAISTPSVEPAAKQPPTKLTLLYTSSAQGEIRSCNCTKFRFGGYGREMTLLKSVRKECASSVLVEGGDVCTGVGFQQEMKADVAAQAFQMLDYAAIVPGEEELGVRGTRYADRFAKSAPLVCANLFSDDEDKRAYAPYVIKETADGTRVGVIGLVGKNVGAMYLKNFKQTIKNPADILPAVVKELKPKCELVVVVCHAPVAEAEELAGTKGVSAILATERTDNLVPFPKESGNEVEAAVVVKDGCAVINACTKSNWSLGKVDMELGADGKVKSAKHKLMYLDRRYEEDPEMVKVYNAYNQKVKDTVLTQTTELRTKAEAILVKRGMNLQEMRQRLYKSPFATAEKCKSCHEAAYDAWVKSRHAHAMATLEKAQQEFDPECVGCHSTGISVRNGYRNQRETPELANVQCEACHGAGLDHTSKPEHGFGKTGEQMCRSCHTDDRSPDFDYETALGQVKH